MKIISEWRPEEKVSDQLHTISQHTEPFTPHSLPLPPNTIQMLYFEIFKELKKKKKKKILVDTHWIKSWTNVKFALI